MSRLIQFDIQKFHRKKRKPPAREVLSFTAKINCVVLKKTHNAKKLRVINIAQSVRTPNYLQKRGTQMGIGS